MRPPIGACEIPTCAGAAVAPPAIPQGAFMFPGDEPILFPGDEFVEAPTP